MQEVSWKMYKLCEADSTPKLAWKLSQFKNGDAKVSTNVDRNFWNDTICVFKHQKTDKRSKNCLLLSRISHSNCKWLFFAVKKEFRAITQRHHMGISGTRSKQLCAPYGVSRARWVKQSFIKKVCHQNAIKRRKTHCTGRENFLGTLQVGQS